MSNVINDGYTRIINTKMMDWGLPLIYDMEDNVTDPEKTEEQIIDYLKDIRCSMPLGMALRRYICSSFGKKTDTGYSFELSDGRVITVSDYTSDDYDIEKDDIAEYTDLFFYYNEKFNGDLLSKLNRAEARRLLRITTFCTREKMFLISFALHMDSEIMKKFLTDYLAEQTYNYRSPQEIIAYFCQSNPYFNSYAQYCELLGEYERIKAEKVGGSKTENYTMFAKAQLECEVTTREELMSFLSENISNFEGYSETAYREFKLLFDKALADSEIQGLSNDDYILSPDAHTIEQLREKEARINNSIELRKTDNTEQLAKAMLRCIPRAEFKRKKDNKTVIERDFINIYNGERGQKSKKIKTTSLPKEITMNLLVKDRLDDLLSRRKPVTRRDLVFLKFYNFSLYLEKKEDYTSNDMALFIDECNGILLRCGMSKLYPANRFENLILLSLYSEHPFEMFEDIIENSFVNEPTME